MFLTIVYDPKVWTEFGYTVQKYIGSSVTVGIKIFAIVFGISLVAKIIRSITGTK